MATATVQIRVSDVDELRENAGNLFVEHFCEVGRTAGVRDLRPDWDRLERLEQGEVLICLAAWFGEECVGYCVSVITTHTHCRDQHQIVNDSIFVSEPVRRKGVGRALMGCMEDIAMQYGADCVWHAPSGGFLDRLLSSRVMTRKGYSPAYTCYIKGAE